MPGDLPLVRVNIELAIQLPHGDGLGVHHKRVHRGEGEPIRGKFALDCCQRITEHFVTLPPNKCYLEHLRNIIIAVRGINITTCIDGNTMTIFET